MTVLDVFIDGTPLNTSVSGVNAFQGRRGLAGRRVVSVTAPGQHGVIPVNGAFDPYAFSVSMWVVGDTLVDFEANLGNLLGLFAKPGLMEVSWIAPDGTTRYGSARLMGAVDPEVRENELLALFTVVMELPRTWWRAAGSTNFMSAVFNAERTLPLLSVSTAPVVDATFTVTGPATSPKFSTPRGFVQYTKDLLGGQTLTISNSGLWAKVGTTPATIDLIYSGSNPRFLDLYQGDRVTCTAGGTTIASQWTVTARASYL